MRQAFHIFRKDIRYLRYDLLLVMALEAIFCLFAARHLDTTWVEILLPVAATYLIVRLIHAETIPGDTQFWITRPYRWRSLAGAKLLFILAFVQLPLFAVQLLILIVEKFPLADTLPGLLWTQFLMLLAVWLPVAALAAMTSSIVPFIFSVLSLLAIGFGAQETLFLSRVMLRWRQHAAQWPEGVDWIRTSILVIALMIVALPVLYFQYRKRRTFLSRSYALGASALALALYVLAPWQPAMAMQSWLSKQPSAGSSIQIAAGSVLKKENMPRRLGEDVNLYIPIAIKGVPARNEVQADALAVTIETADGRKWKSDVTGVNPVSSTTGAANFQGTVPVERGFFIAEARQPATIHATLYLTLFGNERSQSIPLKKTPVNVMDGLQCYSGDIFDHVYCRSAFRWPGLLVYSYSTVKNPLYQLVSYSPFPSGISLNDAIEAHWADGPSEKQVTIVVEEPLAHLHRDLEMHGVLLADFAGHNN